MPNQLTILFSHIYRFFQQIIVCFSILFLISDKQDNTRCPCRRLRYGTMYFRNSGKVRRRDRTLAEMEYCGSPDLQLFNTAVCIFFIISGNSGIILTTFSCWLFDFFYDHLQNQLLCLKIPSSFSFC